MASNDRLYAPDSLMRLSKVEQSRWVHPSVADSSDSCVVYLFNFAAGEPW